MTAQEVAEVLAFVYSAFPRYECSKQTAETFAIAMADMDYDFVKQAAVDWVRDHNFPPSVSQLRGRAKELQDSRRGIARTQATTAALPAGQGNDAKTRAQLANLQAWQQGLIDTETMMRDGARIYAEMPPIPSDAAEVMAAADTQVEALRKRRAANGDPAGNVAGPLRSAAGRLVSGARTSPEDDPIPYAHRRRRGGTGRRVG